MFYPMLAFNITSAKNKTFSTHYPSAMSKDKLYTLTSWSHTSLPSWWFTSTVMMWSNYTSGFCPQNIQGHFMLVPSASPVFPESTARTEGSRIYWRLSKYRILRLLFTLVGKEKLKRTEAAVDENRSKIDTKRTENYSFASLAAVPYAHIVAKRLKNKKPKGPITTLAPNLKDIIFRWLFQYMRALTHAHLDRPRALIAPYFFLVISQLIIFTLFGVTLSECLNPFRPCLTIYLQDSVSQVIVLLGRHALAKEILHNFDKLPGTINKADTDQASFWLKHFPTRSFLVEFDLAQVINLLWISFKMRTRETFVSGLNLQSLTTPSITPLVAFAAAVVFLDEFLGVPTDVRLCHESRDWRSNWECRGQSFTILSSANAGSNGIDSRSPQWLSTVPPFLTVIFFELYVKGKFDASFRYFIPIQEQLRNAHVHSDRGDKKGRRLEHRFEHPALHAELFVPMVHAKMISLLHEIHHSKVSDEKVQVKASGYEYGGRNIQKHLEYDPVLYQRIRGEINLGERSTTLFECPSSMPTTPGFSDYEASSYLSAAVLMPTHAIDIVEETLVILAGLTPDISIFLMLLPHLILNFSDQATVIYRRLIQNFVRQ
ncbi:hypothetical protein K435DRAFT_850328 [Dendrothele bispora CBS 962.96]|uniref:Uncharacterized protein n=1 Tax=Dendrothele bispora (strain CBS 962.96) TaxID=1314807 RepID=A0A4S8MQG3_DENBC|nr:hypothetical protein K435DRAFT_850328 [Dendrothele bispora CBS 962.96]